MRSLVVGYGEIGKAVHEVMKADYAFDVELDFVYPEDRIDLLHICFPYSETFVKDVKDYIEIHQPKHILIWSTLPIGTCKLINDKVCHSPVEGVHPHLAKSIRLMTKWVSYNNSAEGKFYQVLFNDLNIGYNIIENTDVTEFLKLRSTSKYGINLAWADYESSVCKELGIPYDYVQDFDIHYNNLYKKLDKEENARYVLFPPNGEIGGHCIVPNAELLNSQFPSDLLDKIIAMKPKKDHHE